MNENHNIPGEQQDVGQAVRIILADKKALQGVKAVRSRCDEGRLLDEVRFAGPAGKEELARVAKPVQEFKAATPSPIGTPLPSLCGQQPPSEARA